MDRIMVIGDEPALGETLARELEHSATLEQVDFTRAQAALECRDHNLILIDDGPDAASVSERANAPVVKLKRPVRLSELLYTIQERLQGKNAGGASEIAVGTAFMLSPSERMLRALDGSVHTALTEKETELLQAFLAAGEQLMPRDRLLAQVWGYGDNIATHTLETHIYRLRGKLRQTGETLDILSLDEGGYRLKVEENS